MRVFHWMFALCFTGAYITSESERFQIFHAALGYTMLALLFFRLIYGWVGPRSVRWASVMTKLKTGYVGLRDLHALELNAQNFRALQNFLMVLSTVLLLVLPLPLILSGHVLYEGASEAMEVIHELVADIMWQLVVVHLVLLLLISFLRGTNLAMPMWRGRIEGAGPDLVSQPRIWLGVALGVISIGFGVWSVS